MWRMIDIPYLATEGQKGVERANEGTAAAAAAAAAVTIVKVEPNRLLLLLFHDESTSIALPLCPPGRRRSEPSLIICNGLSLARGFFSTWTIGIPGAWPARTTTTTTAAAARLH